MFLTTVDSGGYWGGDNWEGGLRELLRYMQDPDLE